MMEPEPRFQFGENWQDYAKGIGQEQIAMAEIGLRRLLANTSLKGKRFLDIGCGSGLHTLAAIRLGASHVVAVDLDPLSIQTTKALLTKLVPNAQVRIEQKDALTLSPADLGTFDVVYSWGVLHHTGAMRHAIKRATTLVNDKGQLVIALYRRTWLCPFWKIEKRWYASAESASQARVQRIYIGLFKLAFQITARNFDEYVSTYKRSRGMDFAHDVHDWLGGYPYESITPREMNAMMQSLGFKAQLTPAHQLRQLGLFGSGCDEYVYVK